jgi:hypothetical protein
MSPNRIVLFFAVLLFWGCSKKRSSPVPPPSSPPFDSALHSWALKLSGTHHMHKHMEWWDVPTHGNLSSSDTDFLTEIHLIDDSTIYFAKKISSHIGDTLTLNYRKFIQAPNESFNELIYGSLTCDYYDTGLHMRTAVTWFQGTYFYSEEFIGY